jgi:hypothetical protein
MQNEPSNSASRELDDRADEGAQWARELAEAGLDRAGERVATILDLHGAADDLSYVVEEVVQRTSLRLQGRPVSFGPAFVERIQQLGVQEPEAGSDLDLVEVARAAFDAALAKAYAMLGGKA